MRASPWWMPDVHADRQPFLQARRRILAALREYLAEHDFTEVETAILQRSPGNEAHLHAFKTELVAPDRTAMPLYLHTSPEFACKKLLAAGERRIFEFARVFRNRERGALHHPEFTMLEWYRAGEPYEAVMADCVAFVAAAADRRRHAAGHIPGPQRRSLRRAGVSHRRRGLRPPRRHRPPGDAAWR